MSSAQPIQDRFIYAGRTVLAVWCSAPWRPEIALVRQCSGLCFDEAGHLLLVSGDGQHWALPGGHLEPGEALEDTLCREVREEACARVGAMAYLGCQRIHEEADGQALPVYYQARFWARVVLDPFAPRHEIVQRRLVTPDQAARLLGWGESPILAHLLSLTTGLERRAPRGGEG